MSIIKILIKKTMRGNGEWKERAIIEENLQIYNTPY